MFLFLKKEMNASGRPVPIPSKGALERRKFFPIAHKTPMRYFEAIETFMKNPLFLTTCLLLFALPSFAEPSKTLRGSSPAKQAILEMVKTSEEPEGIIQLPLRVFLISNLTMNREDEEMEVWVKPADFEKKILPEINRIWKQANVEWVLESIQVQPAPDLPNREKMIESIENATRDSSPQRVPNILRLCSAARGHSKVNNLYLFPYVGQTQQGFASQGGNKAVVGSLDRQTFARTKAPPSNFPSPRKDALKSAPSPAPVLTS